jgi:hypothetical protein
MAVIDTTTEIANLALVKLGAARILSIEDDVKNAREIRQVWNLLRDAELAAHNWKFAIKRALLPKLESATPVWGYNSSFELPADCINVVEVNDIFVGINLQNYRNISPIADYEISGQVINCNFASPLKIRYVSRVEITGLWDPNFKVAFAMRLAMDLCETLTQSNTKRQLAQAEYKAAIAQAVRSDAIQGPPSPLADDTWIMSRQWS